MYARIAIVGIVLTSAFLFARPATAPAGSPSSATVEIKLPDRTLVGEPLKWSKQRIYLLDRSGWLHTFSPSDVTDYRKVSDRFTPYSASGFRASLFRELGSKYSLTATTHFLCTEKEWGEQLEDLYGSFTHFFAVRKFHIEKPQLPMAFIVCSDMGLFNVYSGQTNGLSPTEIRGHYSRLSNRAVIYRGFLRFEQERLHSKEEVVDTALLSTVIHEGTHHIAYNTGVHNRYCPPPLWVYEGLASLFEAPGIHAPSQHRTLESRINRHRLRHYQEYVLPTQSPERLKNLIASDPLIASQDFHSLAWAYTFYLSEMRPSEYAKYVAATASGKRFAAKSRQQRLAEFTRVFGSDWSLLNGRFNGFMKREEIVRSLNRAE